MGMHRPRNNALQALLVLIVALTGFLTRIQAESAAGVPSSETAVRIAAQLLHYAESTGEAERARAAAKVLHSHYPEPSKKVLSLVCSALQRENWEQVSAKAERSVENLGRSYRHQIEGGPLAPLFRTLINDLSPATVDRQKAVAEELYLLFPEVSLFGLLAEALTGLDQENHLYAKLYLQSEALLEQLIKDRDALQERGVAVNFTDKMTPLQRRQQFERELKALEDQIAAAKARSAEGLNYRPIDVGLRDLSQAMHTTIDELETLGDL